MSLIINPSSLNFNGREIRSFAEAVFADIYDYPAASEYTTIVPNIKAKQQIVLIGRMSKITRLDPGCGIGQISTTVPISQKFWNPVDIKIWLPTCWKDFLATFMVYFERASTQKPDLTVTEIFSQFLLDQVSNAAAEDFIRIAWFADTAIATSDLSNPVDVVNYNQIDGMWKQIFAIAAANPLRRVTIAKNAGATFADQTFTDADTTNQVATKVFLKLTMSADTRLRAEKDGFILSTRSLTDQYMLERMAQTNIPLAYTRTETGFDSLVINGVPVHVVSQWDRVIQGDLVNATNWHIPHRAVYSSKDNLQIGIDGSSEAAISNWDIWYSKDLETANIKGLYKLDAKVIEDYEVQVAY